ncbi:MAG: translation initiation factor IF-2 subunit alpha [Desulfurococcaceae archaeon]
MPIPRRELPNVGEYVVATVREIFDYGAYVTLDEFNDLRAYLPWSEVASKWVKNIREIIRENQKIIVKVIRVDHVRKTVDVSLKKVPDNEKKRKMLWWKQYLKASKIIELTASKIGKSIEEAYREVVWKLEEHYGNPYLGLEELLIKECSALTEANVSQEWCIPLLEEARKHIRIETVKIRVILTLRCFERDGVDRIRKVLLSISDIVNKYSNVKHRIYVLGSPRYILELYGYEYRELEKTLGEIIDYISKKSIELNIEFKYERV